MKLIKLNLIISVYYLMYIEPQVKQPILILNVNLKLY